ncbi:hypothetical protein EVAR_46033_1 [Eumeta japonica]|uniref:Uncharacterized protein n=1 Tax=Eumeta variegata TaxID=151549 RepID=A0A4C1XHP3_EUMVA|nr:hypothetical protein EVAR_46033_1 [Eumeta japonica]
MITAILRMIFNNLCNDIPLAMDSNQTSNWDATLFTTRTPPVANTPHANNHSTHIPLYGRRTDKRTCKQDPMKIPSAKGTLRTLRMNSPVSQQKPPPVAGLHGFAIVTCVTQLYDQNSTPCE